MTQSPSGNTALDRICEVIMFENWLRFYFIAESDNGTLTITLPEKALDLLEKKYPTLVGLAKQLHLQEVTHQNSLEAVCMFIATGLDGEPIAQDTVMRIFDSPAFQLEIQLFSSWIQTYEKELDSTFMEFSTWQEMYRTWRATDQVQEYIATLKKSSATGGSTDNSTVH